MKYFLFDFLAAIAAGITVTLLFKPVQFDIGLYFGLIVFISILFPFLNLLVRHIWRAGHATYIGEITRVIASSFVCFLIITAYFFMVKEGSTYSRGWTVLTFLGICFYSAIFNSLFFNLLIPGKTNRKVVIVGTGDLSVTLHRRMISSLSGLFTPIAFCNLDEEDSIEKFHGLPVLSGVSELLAFIEKGRRGELDSQKKRHVEEVWITISLENKRKLYELQKELSNTASRVYYVPDLLSLGLKKYDLSTLFNLPVMDWTEVRESSYQTFLKRVIDILLAITALVFLLPLLVLLSIGVMLSTEGTILFKQKRYGLDGREFTLLKFRSMNQSASQNSHTSIDQVKVDDPRVTSIGRIMRKYSLDELPQLLNIIKGDMSIVGPRPHASEHNEYFREKIDGYMSRHRMKPGLTGWAQVNGYRGETPQLEDMERRLNLDLAYIENWSPLLDLKIIIKTFFVIITAKNAY